MRILIFARCLYSGGTERVAAQLSLIFHRLGHDVLFITDEDRSELDYEHFSVRRIVARGDAKRMEIRKMLEGESLDLAIVNGGWNGSWVAGILQELHSCNVKTMVVMHHSFDNWLFSQVNWMDFEKGDVLPFVDCLVCVDKIQALWWSRRHGCVRCIENPVAISPDSNRYSEKSNNIVWVGRPMDLGKRVDLAIEIFIRCWRVNPRLRLNVVGEISAKKKKELYRKFSSITGMDVVWTAINFIGYVADVTKYFKDSFLNLVTTLWEVTVPQVILEAQACGVPTIALDLPVLRNVPGVLLTKDCESCAQLIGDLKRNEDKLLAHSKSAGEYAKIMFDDVALKNKWESVINEVCMGNAPNELLTDYLSMDVVCKLLDEIQRAEGFFVANNLKSALVINRIRFWCNKILSMVGGR